MGAFAQGFVLGGGEGGGPSALRAHTPHRDAAPSAGMGLSRASRGVRQCFSPQSEDAASNLGSGRSSSRKHSTMSFQQISCRCHLCCCYSRGWGCAWAVLGCSSSGSSSQMLLFRLTCVLSTQGPCGPGGTWGQVQWGGMQLRLCGVVFAELIKQKKGGKKKGCNDLPSSSSTVILGSCWLPWITEPLVVSHCSEPEGVGLGHSEPCRGGESSKKCHKCNT